MAITIAAANSCELPNGSRQVIFTVTFDNSYAAGPGEVFDVSAWFSGSPDVNPGGGDDGYVIQHDRGTAAAGVLIVYEAGADGAALDEVAGTTDLSALIAKVTVTGTPVLS